MPSSRIASLLEDVAVRGGVWSLIGLIFGSLFAILAEGAVGYLVAPFDLVLASAGAAALTSLFYGSMRLTVMVANFTFVAMLIYTWLGPAALGLGPLVFIGAGVGVAVGAAYGLKDKASRIFCAEAKIMAGTLAGLVAGMLALLLRLLFDDLPLTLVAMLVAPVAVLLYIVFADWFISHCHHLLPAYVDGMVVGFGVGGMTGLVFLIMAGALEPSLLDAEALRSFVARVEASWGLTAAGCALTCLLVGVTRALMRLPWYDR
jgi:hypothetical protein